MSTIIHEQEDIVITNETEIISKNREIPGIDERDITILDEQDSVMTNEGGSISNSQEMAVTVERDITISDEQEIVSDTS